MAKFNLDSLMSPTRRRLREEEEEEQDNIVPFRHSLDSLMEPTTSTRGDALEEPADPRLGYANRGEFLAASRGPSLVDLLFEEEDEPLYPEVEGLEPLTEGELRLPGDAPTERNFFEGLGESMRRGYDRATLDTDAINRAIGGDLEVADLIGRKQQLDLRETDDPIDSDWFLEDWSYGLAGMLPAMGVGLTEGAALGGVYAAIGATGGPGGAGVGYGIGQAVGSTQYWARQGAGSAYLEMREAGVDPAIALATSLPVGVAYAAVERSQLSKVLPKTEKKLLAETVRRTLAETVTQVSKKYAKGVGHEVAEEVAQELILMTGENLGAAIHNTVKDTEVSADMELDRLFSTMTESVGPLALLMLPGRLREGQLANRKRQEILDMYLELSPEEKEFAGFKADATPEEMIREWAGEVEAEPDVQAADEGQAQGELAIDEEDQPSGLTEALYPRQIDSLRRKAVEKGLLGPEFDNWIEQNIGRPLNELSQADLTDVVTQLDGRESLVKKGEETLADILTSLGGVKWHETYAAQYKADFTGKLRGIYTRQGIVKEDGYESDLAVAHLAEHFPHLGIETEDDLLDAMKDYDEFKRIKAIQTQDDMEAAAAEHAAQARAPFEEIRADILAVSTLDEVDEQETFLVGMRNDGLIDDAEWLKIDNILRTHRKTLEAQGLTPAGEEEAEAPAPNPFIREEEEEEQAADEEAEEEVEEEGDTSFDFGANVEEEEVEEEAPAPVTLNLDGEDIELTDEQAAEWLPIEADFNRQRDVVRNSEIRTQDQKDRELKAIGMQRAAEKRRITGRLTAKEQAAADAAAQTIIPGRMVRDPEGHVGEVVRQPVFGKAKVRFEDGEERSVNAGDLEVVEIEEDEPEGFDRSDQFADAAQAEEDAATVETEETLMARIEAAETEDDYQAIRSDLYDAGQAGTLDTEAFTRVTRAMPLQAYETEGVENNVRNRTSRVMNALRDAEQGIYRDDVLDLVRAHYREELNLQTEDTEDGTRWTYKTFDGKRRTSVDRRTIITGILDELLRNDVIPNYRQEMTNVGIEGPDPRKVNIAHSIDPELDNDILRYLADDTPLRKREAMGLSPSIDVERQVADRPDTGGDLFDQPATAPPPVDTGTIGLGNVDEPNADALVPRFRAMLRSVLDGTDAMNLNGRIGKHNVRSFIAREMGVKPKDVDKAGYKKFEEMMERAVVEESRAIAQDQTLSDGERFEKLKLLYSKQPNLSQRTSGSVQRQAFSTPAPLAFVASRLAGIDGNTRVYEPTAGNGMLVMEADPTHTAVNELDPQRAGNLASQGFAPTTDDATDPYTGPVSAVDVVIANPPFGALDSPVLIDGHKITQIDHEIALNALSKMNIGGKAVLIVGAPKINGSNPDRDTPFMHMIYTEYNVVNHFEVAGDLYKGMGAGWPVRVIVIDGADGTNPRTERLERPPKKPMRYKSWDDLFKEESIHGQFNAAPQSMGAARGDGSGAVVPPVEAGAAGSADVREPTGGAAPGADTAAPDAAGAADDRGLPGEGVGAGGSDAAGGRVGARPGGESLGTGGADPRTTGADTQSDTSAGGAVPPTGGRAGADVDSRGQSGGVAGVDYGASNSLFTKDQHEQDLADLRDELNNLQMAVINPKLAAIGMRIAGYHIEAGARAFADYSRAVMDELSDQLGPELAERARPYLRSWYEAVRHTPQFDASGMTPVPEMDEAVAAVQREVEAFDAGARDRLSGLMDEMEAPAEEEPAARPTSGLPPVMDAVWSFNESGDFWQMADASKRSGLGYNFLVGQDVDETWDISIEDRQNYDQAYVGGIFATREEAQQYAQFYGQDIFDAFESMPEGERDSAQVPFAPPEPGAPVAEEASTFDVGEEPTDQAVEDGEALATGGGVAERAADEVVLEATDFQAPYAPHSGANVEPTLTPVHMQKSIDMAMDLLRSEVGDIDAFVVDRLGFADPSELHKALYAHQVDAVALAIYQLEGQNGSGGFIIGDQTGVGKGRIGAAIMRYAIQRGKKPLFFTAKNNLFSDMHRDMTGLGIDHARILTVNAGSKGFGVVDGNGNMVYKPGGRGKQDSALQALAQGQDVADVVMSTYDQVNRYMGHPQELQRINPGDKASKHGGQGVKLRWLMDLAKDNIVIMDESHLAGGKSNQGQFMQHLLQSAQGAVYLSATYAKEPRNMPVYSRTSLEEATQGDMEALVDMVTAGGVPMQEVIAALLTESGQYVRREKSFEGIELPVDFDESRRDRDREEMDTVTGRLRSIVEFDMAFNDWVQGPLAEELDENWQGVRDMRPNGERQKLGVESTKFTSLLHNVVGQTLLSLKAEGVANAAIAAYEQGQKPVIAVYNTMGAFLERYVEENELIAGMSASDLTTFGGNIESMLDRTLRITVKNPDGTQQVRMISPAELPPDLQSELARVRTEIETMEISLPASPIDYIQQKLRDAGMRVGELTGREVGLDYEDGYDNPKIRIRSAQERSDRNTPIQAFNGGTLTADEQALDDLEKPHREGELDALIINTAASTGLSLHASETFGDRRQRKMFIVQGAPNINDYVQMLGRINRVGQVHNPLYSNYSSDLPAELRPLAVVMDRMAKLNANTSAKSESALTLKGGIDFLNEYGDRVVWNFLRENPYLVQRLYLQAKHLPSAQPGEDFPAPSEIKNLAGRASGYAALLPSEEQEEFFDNVGEAYAEYIAHLDATGENELAAAAHEWDAVEVGKPVTIFEGTGNSGFSQNAVIETLRTKMEGKAMSLEEIEEQKNLNTEGKPHNFMTDLREGLRRDYEAWIAQARTRLTDAQLEASREAADKTFRTLNQFEIGSTISLAVEGGGLLAVPATLIGVKRRKTKERENPALGSKITFVFAPAHPMRQTAPLPVSRFEHHTPTYYTEEQLREAFEGELAQQGHRTRKVVTGNLPSGQAVVGSQGRIVRFTREGREGYFQGIALPENFDVEGMVKKGGQQIRRNQLQRFVEMAVRRERGTTFMQASNGITLNIEGSQAMDPATSVRVDVPGARSVGGDYYLEGGRHSILAFVRGEFEGTRDTMTAYTDAEGLRQIIEKLGKRLTFASPDAGLIDRLEEERGIELGIGFNPLRAIKAVHDGILSFAAWLDSLGQDGERMWKRLMAVTPPSSAMVPWRLGSRSTLLENALGKQRGREAYQHLRTYERQKNNIRHTIWNNYKHLARAAGMGWFTGASAQEELSDVILGIPNANPINEDGTINFGAAHRKGVARVVEDGEDLFLEFPFEVEGNVGTETLFGDEEGHDARRIPLEDAQPGTKVVDAATGDEFHIGDSVFEIQARPLIAEMEALFAQKAALEEELDPIKNAKLFERIDREMFILQSAIDEMEQQPRDYQLYGVIEAEEAKARYNSFINRHKKAEVLIRSFLSEGTVRAERGFLGEKLPQASRNAIRRHFNVKGYDEEVPGLEGMGLSYLPDIEEERHFTGISNNLSQRVRSFVRHYKTGETERLGTGERNFFKRFATAASSVATEEVHNQAVARMMSASLLPITREEGLLPGYVNFHEVLGSEGGKNLRQIIHRLGHLLDLNEVDRGALIDISYGRPYPIRDEETGRIRTRVGHGEFQIHPDALIEIENMSKMFDRESEEARAMGEFVQKTVGSLVNLVAVMRLTRLSSFNRNAITIPFLTGLAAGVKGYSGIIKTMLDPKDAANNFIEIKALGLSVLKGMPGIGRMPIRGESGVQRRSRLTSETLGHGEGADAMAQLEEGGFAPYRWLQLPLNWYMRNVFDQPDTWGKRVIYDAKAMASAERRVNRMIETGMLPAEEREEWTNLLSRPDADNTMQFGRRMAEMSLKAGRIREDQFMSEAKRWADQIRDEVDTEAFHEVGTYMLDYANKPRFMRTLNKAGGLGYQIAPYWNFQLQFMRTMGDFIGSGLRGAGHLAHFTLSGGRAKLPEGYSKDQWIEDIAKGMTLASAYFMADMVLSMFGGDDEEEMRSEVAGERLHYEYQTTGRIKLPNWFKSFVGEQDNPNEFWARVADIPILGDVAMMKALAKGRIDMPDFLSSKFAVGDMIQAGMAMFGYNNKFSQYKDTGSIMGELAADYLLPIPYLQMVRELYDGNKRQSYDNNESFVTNFGMALQNHIPGLSDNLPERPASKRSDAGDFQKYDTTATLLRHLVLNIRAINPEHRRAAINEAYRESYRSMTSRIKSAWGDPRLTSNKEPKQPVPIGADPQLKQAWPHLPSEMANRIADLEIERTALMAEWTAWAGTTETPIYETDVRRLERMNQAQTAWAMEVAGNSRPRIARALRVSPRRVDELVDQGAPGQALTQRADRIEREGLQRTYREFVNLWAQKRRPEASRLLQEQMGEGRTPQLRKALLQGLGYDNKKFFRDVRDARRQRFAQARIR